MDLAEAQKCYHKNKKRLKYYHIAKKKTNQQGTIENSSMAHSKKQIPEKKEWEEASFSSQGGEALEVSYPVRLHDNQQRRQKDNRNGREQNK